MQDHTSRAALTALAQQPSLTAVPFTLTALGGRVTWNAHNAVAELVCDAGEYVMARRSRQRGRFIPRKTGRAFRAVLPAWMLPVFTVCLVIPGPFDEAGAGLAALVLLVMRFPRARSAWKGGKTHRKAAQS